MLRFSESKPKLVWSLPSVSSLDQRSNTLYEFSLYLICLLSVLAISAPSLTFTVPFALCTDVVAEHGAEDEVFLGRQLVKRTGDKQTDGIETFAATEVDVHVLLASGLHHIVYRLAAQAMAGLLLEPAVTGEEYHPAHTFLIFIDMIHQHSHL